MATEPRRDETPKSTSDATDAGTQTKRTPQEASVREIIASARSAAPPTRGVIVLSGLSMLMLWASFTPVGWGAIAWLCLVPVIALVRPVRRSRFFYTALYFSGLAYWLVTLQWMRLGDPAMYLAWFALAIYLAFYLPVFVGLSRLMLHRLGTPLFIVAPITWVALELCRAHIMTGFAWYNLGHTQYRWIELIQISDITGAYGVGFLIVMTSSVLAGLLPTRLFCRLNLIRPQNGSDSSGDNHADAGDEQLVMSRSIAGQTVEVVLCLVLFVAVLGYGYFRRSQAEFVNGPRIALIQGNFTASLKHDQSQWPKIYSTHDALTGMSVRHQPDVIIWPESMFRWPLFTVADGMTDEDLQRVAPHIHIDNWKDSYKEVSELLADTAGKADAALVMGIDTNAAEPDQVRRYNSAAFVRPGTGLGGRYDKIHRIIFGEYIPLRDIFPWLHRLTPFADGWGIDAGNSINVFNYKNWRLAPIICFEDTVPHLVRNMAKQASRPRKKGEAGEESERPIDCFVNLTNDGWFHGSSELDQHLITAAFRCVECRTPMARAVNTGISAFIDGDGVIVEPEVFVDGDAKSPAEKRTSTRDPQTGHWHKQLNAVLVHTVPLDNRSSLYVAFGDFFAQTCLVVMLCGLLGAFLYRRPRHDDRPAT